MASDQIRQECHDFALHTFGTSYIFEQRLKDTRKKLRLLTFLGIAVPVAVGGIVVSFFAVEASRPFLSWLIVLAGILGTTQLVVTIWALVAKWEDKATYAAVSTSDNNRLSSDFSALAKSNPSDFDVRYERLKLENSWREELDKQQEITEEEKSKGLRAALRQFQRKCVKCAQIPHDMNPTGCPVCGNF